MSTKLPTKQQVRFLLAEDVRQEMAGKVSILGYMPGDRLVVSGESPVPGAAFVIASFSFLFVIMDGEGKFPGRFRIVSPDKTSLAEAPLARPVEKEKGRPALFSIASKPFVGPAFGTYTIELVLEAAGKKATFKFPVLIEKGTD